MSAHTHTHVRATDLARTMKGTRVAYVAAREDRELTADS